MLDDRSRARWAFRLGWHSIVFGATAILILTVVLMSMRDRLDAQAGTVATQFSNSMTSTTAVTDSPLASSATIRESAASGVVVPSSDALPDPDSDQQDASRDRRELRRNKIEVARAEFSASRTPQKASLLICLTIATLIEEYGCGAVSDASAGFKPKRRRRPDDAWSFLLDGMAYEFEDMRFPEYGVMMRALGSEPENEEERRRRGAGAQPVDQQLTEEAIAQILARADEAVGVLR